MIRLAHWDDLSAIQIILKNTDWTSAAVLDCFNENYFIWIVEDIDIKGLMVVRNAIKIWEIMQIAVDAKYQRCGCAKKLLTHLIVQAKIKQVEAIQLEVRLSNIAAMGLYQQFQFHTIGLRKKYYKNGEDAVLMTKLFR